MAVMEMDAHGKCVFAAANASFRHLLQMRGANVIGKPLSLWFREVDALAIAALLRPEVQRSALQIETYLTGDDQNVPYSVWARAITGSRTKRVLLTAHDARQSSPEASPESKESNVQQREDFIATLTHDLKTPIVGANMVLGALLDGSLGPLPAAQADIVRKLHISNQDLLKMIHNLLEVYKYESGTGSFRFDGANLADIVDFCTQDVKPLIENKHIDFKVNFSSTEILLICDEYAIKRVLINLLGNAVKFTPENGSITVEAIEDGDVAKIIVQDNGRGMSDTERDRIFQRFWQGEPGRRYAAGTGLGLYFCHNVVKAHGGTITCDSTPNQGTTFTITLPKHVYAQ